MNRILEWLVSIVGGCLVGVSVYSQTSSVGSLFVLGIVYIFSIRGVLLQRVLIYGAKSSIRTGYWGALAGALIVFVATSVEAGLVSAEDVSELELIVLVVGISVATWALGMQYRASLDEELAGNDQ